MYRRRCKTCTLDTGTVFHALVCMIYMLFYVVTTDKVVPSLSIVVDCNIYFQRTKHHDKYLHEELEYRCIVSQEFVSTY